MMHVRTILFVHNRNVLVVLTVMMMIMKMVTNEWLLLLLLCSIACMQCGVRRCGLLLQMSHVAWSVCLCVCVCVLGTRVSCAKTANTFEMPFGGKLVRAEGSIYYMVIQMPHGKRLFCHITLLLLFMLLLLLLLVMVLLLLILLF